MDPETGISTSPETGPAPENTEGCAVQCLLVVLALLGGLALAVLQNNEIVRAWTYCSGLPSWGVADSGDEFALGFEFLFRVPGYMIVLTAGMAAGARMTRRRSRIVRMSAMSGCALLFAVLAFWADYAFTNGLGSMYISPRCPQGRPPWWPSFVPLRIRR